MILFCPISKRIAVAEMNEEEICDLLEERGFVSSKPKENETQEEPDKNEEL